MFKRILFEWDERKNWDNQLKHGVSFQLAQDALFDPLRVIQRDLRHSGLERRYFCYGRVGEGILTVRFTLRKRRIRLIGAGYWRKGRAIYEKKN